MCGVAWLLWCDVVYSVAGIGVVCVVGHDVWYDLVKHDVLICVGTVGYRCGFAWCVWL